MLFSNGQLWVWLWIAVSVNSFTLDNGNMKKLTGGRKANYFAFLRTQSIIISFQGSTDGMFGWAMTHLNDDLYVGAPMDGGNNEGRLTLLTYLWWGEANLIQDLCTNAVAWQHLHPVKRLVPKCVKDAK